MNMITKSSLVNEYGFRKRTKNKKQFFENSKISMILEQSEDCSNWFIDNSTDIVYKREIELHTELVSREMKLKSIEFRNGLYPCYLNQGNFENSYIQNKQTDEYFMSHEKAKSLLKSWFNYKISDSLMLSNSLPNFDYKIVKTYYKFESRYSEAFKKQLVSLKLYYDIKGYNHEYTEVQTICDYSSESFVLNNRIGLKVPIDLIIELFND